MRIIEFLEKNEISLKTFADACEIPLTTLQSYLENKSEPSATNCKKIIFQSMGAIHLTDLIKE